MKYIFGMKMELHYSVFIGWRTIVLIFEYYIIFFFQIIQYSRCACVYLNSYHVNNVNWLHINRVSYCKFKNRCCITFQRFWISAKHYSISAFSIVQNGIQRNKIKYTFIQIWCTHFVCFHIDAYLSETGREKKKKKIPAGKYLFFNFSEIVLFLDIKFAIFHNVCNLYRISGLFFSRIVLQYRKSYLYGHEMAYIGLHFNEYILNIQFKMSMQLIMSTGMVVKCAHKSICSCDLKKKVFKDLWVCYSQFIYEDLQNKKKIVVNIFIYRLFMILVRVCVCLCVWLVHIAIWFFLLFIVHHL